MNMHVTRQVKLLCKCDYKFVLLFDNKLSNKKKKCLWKYTLLCTNLYRVPSYWQQHHMW
jgi:uncharacterized membrane protein